MRPAHAQDAVLLAQTAASNPFSAHWTENDFAAELAQKCAKIYVAADAADKPLAFIAYRVVAPSAELTNFAVDAGSLRQKIGGNLLAQSIGELSSFGVKEITLEVDTSNIAAINLYKKFNFNTVSLRKKFYNNGNDAALMLLKL